ncbi:hypothetical protein GL263_01210 [Streptomyces durbertensis]|uniref:Antibiotic biosynthesis monooxygenase n=1 Tax=Streptomyces durbertensis TaxID=2448886 RepID=A0ABR6EAL9_9ACTN|nr:hypothetical protein [Streptomyces durbertensis]MBB1242203.1 hypothetical protein [Streptomyces durbertensis]
MRDRDPDSPVTVINRFQVRGDAEEFEKVLADHSEFLRGQPDFDFLVTAAVVDRPGVYVHLGHWRTLRGFRAMAHEAAFAREVRQLGPLVHATADQAMSLGRTLLDRATTGATNIVLLYAKARQGGEGFERRFARLDRACVRLGGFGGSDLLRSTLHPGSYTGVLWWRRAEDCERALADSAYAAGLAELSEVAEVSTERSRHLAYERAFH